MAGFVKTIIRTSLITGVAATAFYYAMPHRASALFEQARGSLADVIDENIDDPHALRAQLREMESEYPKRLSAVRGDLGELNEQIRQLTREKAVAARVVELADDDLAALEPMLAKAEQSRSEGGHQLASLRLNHRDVSLQQAYARANQITQTRIAYSSRAADADHDLGYLRAQAQRLEELLLQLETERTQFQAQIWQLERQVDAIARNERLIDLMGERKKTIDECSRYQAVSLDQLHGRLAEVRSRQEAELDVLASDQQRVSYEDLAKMQLESERSVELETELRTIPGSVEIAPHMRPTSDVANYSGN